ncbi:MAG: VCBS repeat-containing protein, partial [Bacteroidales bacterium]|nr:VCBS repeat-containing protein [Bacteroidales bacterium]
DNDGDLDLVISNVNMPMFIYRNETSEHLSDHHYLKVILKGDQGNTEAIGTKVTVKHQGRMFYLEQMPMRGFKSTMDSRPNLGLGSLTKVDSLIIQWPDDRVTIMTDVVTDQTLTLHQKDAVASTLSTAPVNSTGNTLFEDISSDLNIDYIHRENIFDDFRREGLIYHMMSTEGPRLCKGDVNGDGLEDIYVGGAKGQPGALLVQLQDGSFNPVDKALFKADQICEDTDCALFDADQDGDLDLYVASGGNEFPSSSSALGDRLYLNDGTGHFIKSPQVLPAGKYESTACVRAADFDNDGVTELFVGLRLRPFLYGVPVHGYLLENDGMGNFTNVTADIAPELLDVGMIRDMLWKDVNGDGDKDIILAGDWMPLRVFLNHSGIFTEEKEAFGPDSTEGWWNCLSAGDFDADGDLDLMAGNHGINSRFRATVERPVSMYVNDFDLNGTAEQIICVYEGDTSYPLALKHDLTGQLPRLEKKYPKYEMYKGQQVTDIFTPEQLSNSILLEAHNLESSLFINDGSGHFTKGSLPVEVQFSPVLAAETGDYNGDGNLDILLGGNLYNVKPEIGRYDASYGTYLLGDGKGNFINIPPRISGLRLDGEIRDFMEVTTSKGELLIVAR